MPPCLTMDHITQCRRLVIHIQADVCPGGCIMSSFGTAMRQQPEAICALQSLTGHLCASWDRDLVLVQRIAEGNVRFAQLCVLKCHASTSCLQFFTPYLQVLKPATIIGNGLSRCPPIIHRQLSVRRPRLCLSFCPDLCLSFSLCLSFGFCVSLGLCLSLGFCIHLGIGIGFDLCLRVYLCLFHSLNLCFGPGQSYLRLDDLSSLRSDSI
mmetsp:Transcript_23368/g.46667  ORF Transcript_23368/g.46667 Transcript_23368/m.46667 type:complete len:210 (-) Transcript_23368:1622-2251(-)